MEQGDSAFTVLLVEESEEIKSILVPILQVAGYRILTAASPTECLEKYLSHSEPIHILVATIHLESSRHLFDQFKAVRPKLKVLWLVDAQDYRDKLESVGFYEQPLLIQGIDYMHKPFGKQELLDRIAALRYRK
jgi:DNA-binding response OmpR family regulator